MKITEVFYSLQGEGPYSGMPSIFIRTVGCNLTCSGFIGNSSEDRYIKSVDDILDTDFLSGCDSRYSWDKKYANLHKDVELDELSESINRLTPQFPYHIVVTGGEPTLHQKPLIDLIPRLIGNVLLIETNASVPLRKEFMNSLQNSGKSVIWSNSPKLSFTGEPHSVTRREDVIQKQLDCCYDRYFKFVVRPLREDFDEICSYMQSVNATGNRVCVMPVGATLESQLHSQETYNLCLEYGFMFQLRTHIVLFGNKAMV